MADLYIRNNDTKKAIDRLKRACDLTKNPTHKADIYFQIALIQYEQENFKKLHNTIANGLSYNPSMPELLNFAAYFYATKGKNTTKAQSYITKALQLQPTNSHFLDTQAVIFYKQQKLPIGAKVCR